MVAPRSVFRPTELHQCRIEMIAPTEATEEAQHKTYAAMRRYRRR